MRFGFNFNMKYYMYVKIFINVIGKIIKFCLGKLKFVN